MSKREEYEKKAEELVLPILNEKGFDLVDVEYVKEGSNYYLRLYIDKPGGITIDDCEIVSRLFEEKMDAKDLIKESYILEVSSPGLGRPLKKEKDYALSIGKEVEIRLYKAVDKEKEFFGVLKEYDKDTVTIETEEGEKKTFQKTEISLIRLAFYF